MKLVIAAVAAPLLAVSLVLVIVGGAGADPSPRSTDCGAGGTGKTVGTTVLDADQIGLAHTVVSVVAGRHLPPFAAIVAVATAYTESKLHNSSAQTDHDSEGLFQQRVSIYSEVVAVDPVRATNAFLDRLVKVGGWLENKVGVDAQSVQISAYPQRYEPNEGVARQLVAQFWPSATAAASMPSTAPGSAVCAGAGGAVPGNRGGAGSQLAGPHGGNVAGITTIPSGLVIDGSAKGRRAVTFALRQLGKPYVWGAAGPDAFDCSGLVMAAWARAGTALPHQAAQQVHRGTAEPNNLSQAVAGDLVFIPGSDGTVEDPGHVGMIVGTVDRPDGRHLWLVQAPMTGVPVELTEASRWSGQVTDVRHIA